LGIEAKGIVRSPFVTDTEDNCLTSFLDVCSGMSCANAGMTDENTSRHDSVVGTVTFVSFKLLIPFWLRM